MGTPGDGDLPADGERRPEDPAGLPDLPALPEGVTVPDDASALAEDAERLRAELDQHRRDPPRRRQPLRSEPSLATPLTIMSVAVVITLVSLIAMTWSGSQINRAAEPAPSLPSVVLTDATGQSTDLNTIGPVVILLVESCDCARLIADTAAAAPPGVTVVAVGGTAPSLPPDVPGGADVRLLADPGGELRAALGPGRPHGNTATVVLADRHGIITHRVPAATTTASYQDALADLRTG